MTPDAAIVTGRKTRDIRMKNRKLAVLTAVLLISHTGAMAQDNAEINGIYERMSAAYAALDSAAFADVYAADSVYLRSDENPMLHGVDAVIGNFERFFSSVRDEDGRMELLFRVVKRDCSEAICSDVGWYKLNRYDSGGDLQGTSYGRFLTTPGKGDDGLWRFIADVDTGAEAEHWDAAREVPGLHFARD